MEPYFTNPDFPEIGDFPCENNIWSEVVWGRYNLARSLYLAYIIWWLMILMNLVIIQLGKIVDSC